MEEFLKLILPAKLIPEKSVVTKKTGEKEYILTKSIKIYDQVGKSNQVINANDGTVFLVDGENINVHSGETLMCWVVDESSLLRWLEERQEGSEEQ